MKGFAMRRGVLALVAAVTLGAERLAAADAEVKPLNYFGQVAVRFEGMMTKYHVLRRQLDDEISRRAWTNLVTYYDFDHSVFLKGDLDRFAERAERLDDEIRAGDVSFGFDVRNLYVKRLKERVDFVTNLAMTATFDFSENETYLSRRKDAPWPETREQAEEHWRKRLKNELLVMRIGRELDAEDSAKRKASAPESAGASDAVTNAVTNIVAAAGTNADEKVERPDTPSETIVKRYRQYYTVLTEPDEEEVLRAYLSAMARAYDPHSDYFSPTAKDDFDIEMNLSLCGVGATLMMDDGALKITEILPGGPMDRDGRIEEGDKIVGVRQADGLIEDITWQPMKKSIKKIRGKKGTRVTLEIVPRSDPTGTVRKRIELVRDVIKLEDQAATGRVEAVVLDGVTNRLGYINLPGFYGTMDKRPSDPEYRSCALDVKKIVSGFNASGVDGLVLDLRGNGGGSLREAVMLASVFVHSGPVVMIRDNRNVGALPIPFNNPVAFRKPVVVLTDRASASASEIVAGHLRDTGRAIVLGDRTTHGKGTVQTVLGMGPQTYGSMKITTARFYRVNGRSTQVRGVESDIRLPSYWDSLDVGEDKLQNALPFSSINPAEYEASWNLPDYLPRLRELSEERLRDDERYQKHLETVAGMREISDRAEVPLGYEARKAMMAADRALREQDDELDEDDDDENGEKEAKKPRRRRNDPRPNDVVLDAAFDILGDLVRLNGGAKLPKPKLLTDWYNAILGN